MHLKTIHVIPSDEDSIFNYRYAIFMKFLSGAIADDSIPDEETDQKTVSILNLPSLKRGVTYESPRSKLDFIISDKDRLGYWIEVYKCELLDNTSKTDPVKIATFLEAGTRLKMLLDDSDFDEGNLRYQRQQTILEINKMLKNISELSD